MSKVVNKINILDFKLGFTSFYNKQPSEKEKKTKQNETWAWAAIRQYKL